MSSGEIAGTFTALVTHHRQRRDHLFGGLVAGAVGAAGGRGAELPVTIMFG